jgi:predicted metal-dependent peptidase
VVDGDGNPVKGISAKETQVIRNQVANEVMAAKARGNVPAGIARWAEEQLKSKVPWRTLLTNKVRGMIGEVSGMVNYSYNRPSRRQSVFGKIVMPCLRAPLPQIAMLIDTSGSMSEHELGLAVAEVDGVLRSMGCPVTVISNDAEVGAVKKVRKKGEISLVGGGGTNLGPGIEKSMELKPKINFLIIVSDCDADWGTARPKFPVICVKVGNSRSKPPEWMKTIEVDCE